MPFFGMKRGLIFTLLLFIAALPLSTAQFYTPVNPLNDDVQCCVAIASQDPRFINDFCAESDLNTESCKDVLVSWQAEHTDVLEENSYIFAALVLFILGAIILLIMLAIAAYIYTSFAFMYIGRKIGVKYPEIAWVPLIGKPLMTSHIAKMHWWPILLLIAPVINPFLLLSDSLEYLIAITVIVFVASLVFTIYYYIWRWKMFDASGRPGAWILFLLIPFVGFIIYFVLLGITAWGKDPIKIRVKHVKEHARVSRKRKKKK